MKKLLVIASMLAAAGSTFAQGQFSFTTFLVTPACIVWENSTTSGLKFGGTVNGTKAYVDYVYSATAGVTDESKLTLTQLAAPATLSTSGTFSSGVQTIPGVSQGPISLEVRAWNGATTYSAAKTLWDAGTAGVYTGTSGILQVTLGDPTITPAGTSTSADKWFKTFAVTQAVPEPSTIALGAMGLSLLFFRRRN
jgi:hypothetical protein